MASLLKNILGVLIIIALIIGFLIYLTPLNNVLSSSYSEYIYWIPAVFLIILYALVDLRENEDR